MVVKSPSLKTVKSCVNMVLDSWLEVALLEQRLDWMTLKFLPTSTILGFYVIPIYNPLYLYMLCFKSVTQIQIICAVKMLMVV